MKKTYCDICDKRTYDEAFYHVIFVPNVQALEKKKVRLRLEIRIDRHFGNVAFSQFHMCESCLKTILKQGIKYIGKGKLKEPKD